MTPLILLTNDDGVGAEGLRALERSLPDPWELHVVAPATVMSQCGHGITTHEPLCVHRQGPRHHAVSGTPADCVRLALMELLPRRPDWVLSGINHGGNLGADLYTSGTVAAVREASYMGVAGIALSHYKKPSLEFDWAWAGRCARSVIEELMRLPLGDGEHWNVNLPHIEPQANLPERVDCPPSRRSLPVSFDTLKEKVDGQRRFLYDGVYAERDREPGSDVDVCFRGQISISKLRL